MSNLPRVKISALGTYVPPRLLTNGDLSKMVDTNDEWIMSRVGIKERHIVDKGVGTSDLAAEAARRALAQRGIAASELDAIIVATVTPDMMFPATACLVQHKIGASKAWGFDLSAGCSQFVYALQVGAQFVHDGSAQESDGDRGRRDVVDHRLHRSRDLRAFWRWRGRGDSGADRMTTQWDSSISYMKWMVPAECSLFMPGGGSLNPSSHETVDKKMHYVHQDGAAVFKFAVRQMAEFCVETLKRNGLTGDDLDLMIPHQANLRIIKRDLRPAEAAAGKSGHQH